MQIDRNQFLHLTLLIGAYACGGEQANNVVIVPTQPLDIPIASAKPPPSAAPKPATPVAREEPDPPDDPSCSNAKGSPIRKLCLKVSPSCEGLREECLSLADDFRPRVAEKWAECFAKTTASDCRDPKLGACMRAATESACVEPGTIKTCRGLMTSCREAGKAPDYTLDRCVRILSAVKPSTKKGGGDWDVVDVERLGPSEESGSCSLEYVLPYQPYGANWRDD